MAVERESFSTLSVYLEWTRYLVYMRSQEEKYGIHI